MRYWLSRRRVLMALAVVLVAGALAWYSSRPGPARASGADPSATPTYAQQRDQMLRDVEQDW